MQKELDVELGPGAVQILGINEVGRDSQNDLMCEGRDLPWLQDSAESDVWNSWTHEYRDVIVVDTNNVPVAVYNLSGNDLADAQNYQALKQLFLDALESAE